ncbi:hypothetical protein D9M71_456060 [compost metagenome]
MKLPVSALVPGWKPLSRVSTGSASAVLRVAMAMLKRSLAEYTRMWMSVGCQPLAGSMSSGQELLAQTRSVIARSST